LLTKRRSNGNLHPAKQATAHVVVVSVGVAPRSAPCLVLHDHPAYPELISVMMIGVDPANELAYQTLLSKRFEPDDDLPVLDYESLARQ
jgi:hypothetical protein